MKIQELFENNIVLLKTHRVQLSDDEHKQVMDADAVWHHGPKGEKSPAVWKSVVSGKVTYITNTHRAFATAPTLKGAIRKYHTTIKRTA